MSNPRPNLAVLGKSEGGLENVARHAPEAGSRRDELHVLVQAVQAGDTQAASTLLGQLGGGMLRVVRRVLGGKHPDLDDVAQEATVAVLKALPRFRAESTVQHFANRVTLLAALAARRRSKQRARWVEPLGDHEVASADASPMEAAILARRREAVLELLDTLSEPVARVTASHFMLGHTVEEIARDEGLSPNTVWSRLRLGKQALRRRLDRSKALRERTEGGQ